MGSKVSLKRCYSNYTSVPCIFHTADSEEHRLYSGDRMQQAKGVMSKLSVHESTKPGSKLVFSTCTQHPIATYVHRMIRLFYATKFSDVVITLCRDCSNANFTLIKLPCPATQTTKTMPNLASMNIAPAIKVGSDVVKFAYNRRLYEIKDRRWKKTQNEPESQKWD